MNLSEINLFQPLMVFRTEIQAIGNDNSKIFYAFNGIDELDENEGRAGYTQPLHQDRTVQVPFESHIVRFVVRKKAAEKVSVFFGRRQ